jgi:transmembrane sensor
VTADDTLNRHSDMSTDMSNNGGNETSPSQQALVWLTRRQSGHWQAAEQRELEAWLAADPTHALAWLRAQDLWQGLEGLRPLAREELARARRPRAASLRSNRWAAGLALAGVAACAVWIGLTPGGLDASQVIQTARGEQRTLTLADGSHLQLNTASRVEVRYSPFCRCLKLLSGEAVFKVAHGDVRGFEVQVGAGQVRDIGTEFWLREQTGKVAVAVLAGAVEVRAGSELQATRLQAGQRYAYDAEGRSLPADSTPLADLTAWREGALVFRDTPLTEVLSEFARYHTVHLQLDRKLADYRLSGRFASRDLDGVLRLLERAYPIRVERSANSVIQLRVAG